MSFHSINNLFYLLIIKLHHVTCEKIRRFFPIFWVLFLVHFSCHFQYSMHWMAEHLKDNSLQNICIIYFFFFMSQSWWWNRVLKNQKKSTLFLKILKKYPCNATKICLFCGKKNCLTWQGKNEDCAEKKPQRLWGFFSKSQRFHEPSGVALKPSQ